MVRATLIAAVLASALVTTSRTQAQPTLTLPDCDPTHVDVALLRQVLRIELDGDAAVAIDAALCDASATAVTITVGGASDTITLPTGDDRETTTRALALSIAERTRQLGTAPVESESESEVEPEVDVVPVPVPVSDGVPDRANALSAPAPIPAPTPAPAPTLGLSLRARALPILPSWALGLGVSLGAPLDATFSLRAEVFSTWARATAYEGDVDAVVLAAAGTLAATVLREGALELLVGARVEAGALFGLGWSAGASTGAPSTHPWITAGGELDLLHRLGPGLALAIDVGASGVLWGTRLVTWPSGTQIDYSILTIDVGVGLRFAF